MAKINTDPKSEYVSAKEFAAIRSVTAETIRRWFKAGILQGDQPGGNKGRVFILRSEVGKKL